MINIKSFFRRSENFIMLLLAVLLCSLLITSDFFINTFYTNLFLYNLLSCIFIIGSSIFILSKGSFGLSRNTYISMGLIFFWIVYILINHFFLNTNGEKLKSNYLIISLLLYISLVTTISNYPSLKKNIFIILCIIAFVESSYCILQFLNIIKNETATKITGTWVNPNITAMYLALIFPFVLAGILIKINKQKKLYILLLVFVIISLLLLKCRTAILGTLLATALVLEWRYSICKNFIAKQSRMIIYSTFNMAILVITFIAFFAYYTKKDSADGRKLIWCLSLKMIEEKPLFGYGYGNFERDYNLKQAKYFAENEYTETEKQNAAHTEMAYNEIIENTVEGGIVGSIFLLGFIIAVLCNAAKFLKTSNYYDENIDTTNASDNHVILSAIAGMVVLLFMSLVNFTITAVPIMCVFVLFTSIVCAIKLKKDEAVFIFAIKKIYIILPLGIFGIFLLFFNSTIAYSHREITLAIDNAKNNDYQNALSILEAIPLKNQNSSNFYQSLGNIYYRNNNKNTALQVYEKNKMLSSTPYLYEQLGDCYLSQQDFLKAIMHYEIAMNIQPNRFTPKYLLMNLYIQQKDKFNAIKYANYIVQLKEKVPSRTTKSIKRIAMEFLKLIKK